MRHNVDTHNSAPSIMTMLPCRLMLTMLLLLGALTTRAQDVIVTVSPKQYLLPPQALAYVTNPDKYFNVRLFNTSDEALNVFLGFEIKQLTPSPDMTLTTRAHHQPQKGVPLAPKSTVDLNSHQLRELFQQYGKNDVSLTGGVLADYKNGIIGLLPEGTYEMQMTAYRLDYAAAMPEVLSNPATGKCTFQICYSAKAPEITMPVTMPGSDNNLPQLSVATPIITWMPPVSSCTTNADIVYDLKIVDCLPGQSIDEAMRVQGEVYKKDGILVPTITLPADALTKLKHAIGADMDDQAYFDNQFNRFVMQVTARKATKADPEDFNYTLIENEGRSPLLPFSICDPSVTKQEKKDSTVVKPEKEGRVYTMPRITSPNGEGVDACVITEGEDTPVKWEACSLTTKSDSITEKISFKYNLKLYALETNVNTDSLSKYKALYEKTNLTELNDTLRWNDIKDKLPARHNLMVVVEPVTEYKDSITYINLKDNQRRLYYAKSVASRYPECHPENKESIKNTNLATFSPDELKGMEVTIGAFTMKIKQAKQRDDKKGYEGTGTIEWKPFGSVPFELMVGFDTLRINSDKVVYDGLVTSEKREQNADFIPYEIFDDWGLKNLIGSSTEVYGTMLKNEISKNKSIAKYYNYVQQGAMIADDIVDGKITLQLPASIQDVPGVEFSEDLKNLPFSIQMISAMFTPNSGWLNVMGMFKLPENELDADQILVFGSPRLCIDPEGFSAGSMALLADWSVNDMGGTGAQFRFKAPTDFDNLTDGCQLAWDENFHFSEFVLDAEFTIPGLAKDNGKGQVVQHEDPKVNVKAAIKDWDDWFATVQMDAFQVKDLPDYTFVPTGDAISYDHSKKRNRQGFKLPKGYDLKKAGLDASAEWQGFELSELSMVFPVAIEASTPTEKDLEEAKATTPNTTKSGKDEEGKAAPPFEKRLAIGVKNLLIDNNNDFTVHAYVKNVFDVSTTRVGGWKLTMDEIYLDILQSNFKDAGFSGRLDVPLLEGEIGYKCDIAVQDRSSDGNKRRTTTLNLKVQQIGELGMDMFLAKMKIDKSSFFQLRYDPDSINTDSHTEVEMLLNGEITVDLVADKLDKSKAAKALNLKMPGIHFDHFRLANFKDGKETKRAIVSDDEKFVFDIGKWSLASLEKQLGPFKFKVGDFDIKSRTKDGAKEYGLYAKGGAAIVEGIDLSADAGIILWAKVNLNTFDAEFDEVVLDSLTVDADLLGVAKVKGILAMTDDDEKGKGFGGSLDINVINLFKMKATGGYFELEKDNSVYEQECKDAGDKSGNVSKNFVWGYFTASAETTTGIPMGPVSLNKIKGGFYFNCTAQCDPKYGLVGGMFGFGLTTTAAKETMNGDFDMTVVYDTRKKKLSQLMATGKLHALCAPNSETGLVNADAKLVYDNSDPKERYLQLSITVESGADVKSLVNDFAGIDLNEIEQNVRKGVGMEALQDNSQKEEGDTGKPMTEKEKSEAKAKVGALNFNMPVEFKVTMKPEEWDDTKGSFNTKWHFYLGQPGGADEKSRASSRVSLTLIDFQLGDENSSVAMWAKIYANAYLCLGNELPDGGKLPPIPKAIRDYLDGTDVNGKSQSLSGDAQSAREQAMNAAIGNTRGGIMFGAEYGGSFGLNAVIVYARAEMLAGFDIVLKRLAQGAKCNGRNAGSNNGFYGMGQVYAMAKGELGVMLNLWVFKGNFPIVKAGIGALLQGGFPNPTWAYGKMRCHASLFNGIVDFNTSLQIKMGEVCLPEFGNPLDDVQVFGDFTPGLESKEDGWKEENAVSPFNYPQFTTNFYMDRTIDLVDERSSFAQGTQSKNTCRQYVFHLKEPFTMKREEGDVWGSDGLVHSSAVVTKEIPKLSTTSENTYSFAGMEGTLQPNMKYSMTLEAELKELVNGVEVDPVFQDSLSNGKPENRVCTQAKTYYWCTGELPKNLMSNVAFTIPSIATNGQYNEAATVFEEDMQFPQIHLNSARYDLFEDGDSVYAVLEHCNPGSDRWEVVRDARYEALNAELSNAKNAIAKQNQNIKSYQSKISELETIIRKCQTRINANGTSTSESSKSSTSSNTITRSNEKEAQKVDATLKRTATSGTKRTAASTTSSNSSSTARTMTAGIVLQGAATSTTPAKNRGTVLSSTSGNTASGSTSGGTRTMVDASSSLGSSTSNTSLDIPLTIDDVHTLSAVGQAQAASDQLMKSTVTVGGKTYDVTTTAGCQAAIAAAKEKINDYNNSISNWKNNITDYTQKLETLEKEYPEKLKQLDLKDFSDIPMQLHSGSNYAFFTPKSKLNIPKYNAGKFRFRLMLRPAGSTEKAQALAEMAIKTLQGGIVEDVELEAVTGNDTDTGDEFYNLAEYWQAYADSLKTTMGDDYATNEMVNKIKNKYNSNTFSTELYSMVFGSPNPVVSTWAAYTERQIRELESGWKNGTENKWLETTIDGAPMLTGSTRKADQGMWRNENPSTAYALSTAKDVFVNGSYKEPAISSSLEQLNNPYIALSFLGDWFTCGGVTINGHTYMPDTDTSDDYMRFVRGATGLTLLKPIHVDGRLYRGGNLDYQRLKYPKYGYGTAYVSGNEDVGKGVWRYYNELAPTFHDDDNDINTTVFVNRISLYDQLIRAEKPVWIVGNASNKMLNHMQRLQSITSNGYYEGSKKYTGDEAVTRYCEQNLNSATLGDGYYYSFPGYQLSFAYAIMMQKQNQIVNSQNDRNLIGSMNNEWDICLDEREVPANAIKAMTILQKIRNNFYSTKTTGRYDKAATFMRGSWSLKYVRPNIYVFGKGKGFSKTFSNQFGTERASHVTYTFNLGY